MSETTGTTALGLHPPPRPLPLMAPSSARCSDQSATDYDF